MTSAPSPVPGLPQPAGYLSLRQVATSRLGPIDLDVARGECVAILGASGAGKSLLLRQIADLDPGDGAITLGGASRERLPAPEWRRQVIYCQAEPGWWDDRVAPHFSDGIEAATRLLPSLGLSARLLSAEIHQLSTGERQRLGLARPDHRTSGAAAGRTHGGAGRRDDRPGRAGAGPPLGGRAGGGDGHPRRGAGTTPGAACLSPGARPPEGDMIRLEHGHRGAT